MTRSLSALSQDKEGLGKGTQLNLPPSHPGHPLAGPCENTREAGHPEIDSSADACLPPHLHPRDTPGPCLNSWHSLEPRENKFGESLRCARVQSEPLLPVSSPLRDALRPATDLSRPGRKRPALLLLPIGCRGKLASWMGISAKGFLLWLHS